MANGTCKSCGKTKPLEEGFYPSSHYTCGYYLAVCKACKSLRRSNDVEGARLYEREILMRSKFNITTEAYEAMLASQGGVCAICHQPETRLHHKSNNAYSLSVDHDRTCCPGSKSCGKCIRGLLCFNCNSALGKIETHVDDVVAYLNKGEIL